MCVYFFWDWESTPLLCTGIIILALVIRVTVFFCQGKDLPKVVNINGFFLTLSREFKQISSPKERKRRSFPCSADHEKVWQLTRLIHKTLH